MDRLFEFVGNHYILVSVFVLLLLGFIYHESRRGGKSVTAQELVTLMNQDKAVILDVREPGEYRTGHIRNALNVPVAALRERIGELEKFKSRPVVVACKMGASSSGAGTMLRKAGFERVFKLRGGITEWRSLNFPLVKS